MYLIKPSHYCLNSGTNLNLFDICCNFRYVDVKKSRNKHDNTTVFHHYKVDVFNAAIDQQVTELNHRFSSQVTELLDLCTSLDPRHDNFNKSKICRLVKKFYPADFF
jgi:hypothetical protein